MSSPPSDPLGGDADHRDHDRLSPSLVAAQDVVRRLTFVDFAFEIRFGHHLGYLRAFAVPRVAAVLARAGQIDADPHRRATDTALFVWELIHHGLDAPQGRMIIDRINALHVGHPMDRSDLQWALTTFVVPGLDIIDRYGWRPLSSAERQALVGWWAEVGRRLGAGDLPPDAEGWARLAADYERAHVAPTPEGARLLAATTEVAVSPLPTWLRPWAIRAGAAVFDPRIRRGLGLADPGWPIRVAVRVGLRGRALAHRWRRGPKRFARAEESWFVPGQPHRDHPHGYTLADLGPRPGDPP